MRSLARVSLTLFTAAAACSDPVPVEVFALQYGTTPYLYTSEQLAKDYIVNNRAIIPRYLKACGVNFLSFDGATTDGEQAAYFNVRRDNTAAFQCIEKAFPQGSLGRPSPEIIKWRGLLAKGR